MEAIYPEIKSFIDGLKPSEISKERTELLQQLALYLQSKKDHSAEARLCFICTHNSRRSQLCEVWATTAAVYYGQRGVRAASGGTETTAFHPNAVRALEESGFRSKKGKDSPNPIYEVKFSDTGSPIFCYSKEYTESWPKATSFAAVLNCSEAEEACPFIPEAEARFALKYDDPKIADGTAEEQQVYALRNRQIANEMFYLFSLIK